MIDSEAIRDKWRSIMDEAVRNEWRGILSGEWESFRIRMLSRNVTRVMADVGEDCMELSSYNTGNALMTALGMADPGRSYSNLIYEWVANHIHPVRLVVWLELDFKDNTVAYQSVRSRGLTREAPRRRLLDGSYDLR